jgi:methanesulfonate monooxygenase small subunit
MTITLSGKSRFAIDAARDVVYQSTLLLDAGRAEEWLASLCAATFHYTITTYSPEIRAEQEWFAADREELVELLRLLPRHNSDHGPLSRHVSVYAVDLEGDGEQEAARAVSSVVIYQTLLDGRNSHLDSGTTRLLCTGKYYDRIGLDGGRPVLRARNLRLDTRQLGTGSHVIL